MGTEPAGNEIGWFDITMPELFDVVQKESPAVRQPGLAQATLLLLAAEAKQRVFDRRRMSAVEFDERPLAAFRTAMYGAGRRLMAGPRLSCEQQGTVILHLTLDSFPQGAHGNAVAQQHFVQS